MGKNDRFSPKEIDMAEANLKALRRAFTHPGDTRVQSIADASKASSDEDQPSLQEMTEQAAREQERTGHVLESINAALARVRTKAWGVCQQCDADIPKARLEALPYAENCVLCQEKIEEETRPKPKLPDDWTTR